MVLESTVVCVDNSEYMRNGDFIPTRLQAQQDAVSLVCHSKTRSNPENNVGLLTLASSEVLATLTTDVGRLLSKLHQVQPKGNINFLTAIRIAHLVLKHRQGKNHKMRIVVFVGSPIETDSKELVKLAKRLKKEKVNVDIVNFGEDNINTEKLTTFINLLNGKDGSGSHLVTVPPGPHLSDALISSPVIQGEDGSGAIGLGVGGFEFGVDPNEDPELALALRVSMEEQRQRQEDEARRAAATSAKEGAPTPVKTETEGGTTEEELLERALAMSLDPEPTTATATGAGSATMPDFAAMTEEEQIAYAMQMSLQQAQGGVGGEASHAEPMETDQPKPDQPPEEKKGEEPEDFDMIQDPAFLLYALGNLPGVDPESEAVRNVLDVLSQADPPKEHKEDDKKDKGDREK
ncbi:26S proteasome non-ATPase regulatory subunit 4-like isoform X2 [Ornithodoros turicata]|uniref:26S proteasome non-ATPase regulatory subunit 4-like isoform X2 n=1 Tax=Ornithodoros turicata TaxID=34597 RepID=UPI0031388705